MKGEITLITQNVFELDIFTRKVKDVIGKGCYFVSGDKNAYKVIFKIFDNEEPKSLLGKKILIGFRRANGTAYVDDDVVITNAEQGECEYIIKTDAIAVPGLLYFELYIYDGIESRITTPAISATVRADIDSSANLKASDQYPAIAAIVEKTAIMPCGSFTIISVVSGMTSDIFIKPFAAYNVTHWALYSNGVRMSDVTPIANAIRVNQALLSGINNLAIRAWDTPNPPNPDENWLDSLFEPWGSEQTWGQDLETGIHRLEAAFHPMSLSNGAGYGILIR